MPPRLSDEVKRPSGDERVFAAADGVLWSASLRRGDGQPAIVFSCITDSRRPGRAVAVNATFQLRDASDDQLRGWFVAAPIVGKLI